VEGEGEDVREVWGEEVCKSGTGLAFGGKYLLVLVNRPKEEAVLFKRCSRL